MQIISIQMLIFTLLIMMLFLNGILFSQADIIFYILSGVGLLLVLKEKIRLPKVIKQYIGLGFLFIIFLTLSIAFINIELLFAWRYETYRFIFLLPFVAISIFYLKLDEQLFWRLIVLGSSFTAIWIGLVFYSGELARSSGYLTDPINRGNMGMLYGLLCLVAFFAIHGWGWKLLAVIFFISGVLLSFLSGSRGGWFALVISWFTLMLIFYKFGMKRNLIFLTGILVIFLVVVFLAWEYLPVSGRMSQTIKALESYASGNFYTSLGYRFELWKASIHGFLEKPFLGWGWGNYPDIWFSYLEKKEIQFDIDFGHPHNQYFLFLTELGLIGLVLFLGFFLFPAYYAFKKLKQNNLTKAHVFFITLILVMTESLMEFMLSDSPLSKKYYLITFLVVSLIGLKNLLNQQPKETVFIKR